MSRVGTTYTVLSRPGDGLALIRRADRYFREDDVAVWSRSKLRKATTCDATGVPLSPGDLAYRPVGNQSYRSRRLSVHAVERDPNAVDLPC